MKIEVDMESCVVTVSDGDRKALFNAEVLLAMADPEAVGRLLMIVGHGPRGQVSITQFGGSDLSGFLDMIRAKAALAAGGRAA